MMEHTDKHGNSKVKKQCSLPLTGAKCVDLLVTELGVFSFENGKMKLIELQPNVTLDELKSKTEATFENCL